MLINYHEMTMNEPSNAPAKRKQFTVICSVMVAVLSYTVMTSGVLQPLIVTEGVFPGGHFCYKLTHRDYAASMGLGRRITTDLIQVQDKKESTKERQQVEQEMYHLFLDDPWEVTGRQLRWATGILVSNEGNEKIQKLLALNENPLPPKNREEVVNNGNSKKYTQKRLPTEQEMMDWSAREIMDMIPYELQDLPSVDSLVVPFPHTHGFVSSLVVSYKVIPQLRKLAKEKGQSKPVILATCRKAEDMCTFYAPLVETEQFLLGQQTDSDTYQQSLPAQTQGLFSYQNIKQSIYKLAPFARDYLDKLP